MPISALLYYDILSMLANDGESPWQLHYSLTDDFDYPDLDIAELLDALDEIERRGWAIPWEPIEDDLSDPNKHGPVTAAYKAEALAAYKDVLGIGGKRHGLQWYGPWYEITPEGRAEFERLDSQAEHT